MPQPRLHLAATPGGHLDLLLAIRPAFAAYDRTWVTAPGSSADALEAEGERVLRLPRFHGYSPRLVKYAAQAGRLIARERPRLIVTSGSGSVAPFCALGRGTGARLLFLETMARIEDPSSGGRILSRLASEAVVQWPEMTAVYPGAHVARPALLEDRMTTRTDAGEGTFIALGTHIDPFARLVEVAGRALDAGLLPRPARAQTGVTERSWPGIDAQRWMTPAELQAAVEAARYVVCHAGSGLIARCLRSGIRPLVLARLAEHGEHVDDHQLQLTRKLGEMGAVVPIDGEITAEDVAAASGPPPPATASPHPAMVDLVRERLGALARP